MMDGLIPALFVGCMFGFALGILFAAQPDTDKGDRRLSGRPK